MRFDDDKGRYSVELDDTSSSLTEGRGNTGIAMLIRDRVMKEIFF